jgi:lysozyme
MKNESVKKNKHIVWIGASLLLLGAVCFVLFNSCGIARSNEPSKEEYPVRGIDVSEYQGEIDWQVLSGQDIAFAFIKATEGSQDTDPRFKYNWEHAAGTKIRIGAYHFFNFLSSGKDQAANFIAVVNKADGMLPPVVDIELYDSFKRDPKSAGEVLPELNDLVKALEEAYRMKPIFYASKTVYDLYLADQYSQYPLWIRSVNATPTITGWTFWQYSDRSTLPGYKGKERHIDMNLFHGTAEEFGNAFQ